MKYLQCCSLGYHRYHRYHLETSQELLETDGKISQLQNNILPDQPSMQYYVLCFYCSKFSKLCFSSQNSLHTVVKTPDF